MNDLEKLKLTQVPYVVKDSDGNAIGQITISINHNLTNVSFTMNFQTELKVTNNKEIIKQAYADMQSFFKQELSNCGWSFLFDEN